MCTCVEVAVRVHEDQANSGQLFGASLAFISIVYAYMYMYDTLIADVTTDVADEQ